MALSPHSTKRATRCGVQPYAAQTASIDLIPVLLHMNHVLAGLCGESGSCGRGAF